MQLKLTPSSLTADPTALEPHQSKLDRARFALDSLEDRLARGSTGPVDSQATFDREQSDLSALEVKLGSVHAALQKQVMSADVTRLAGIAFFNRERFPDLENALATLSKQELDLRSHRPLLEALSHDLEPQFAAPYQEQLAKLDEDLAAVKAQRAQVSEQLRTAVLADDDALASSEPVFRGSSEQPGSFATLRRERAWRTDLVTTFGLQVVAQKHHRADFIVAMQQKILDAKAVVADLEAHPEPPPAHTILDVPFKFR